MHFCVNTEHLNLISASLSCACSCVSLQVCSYTDFIFAKLYEAQTDPEFLSIISDTGVMMNKTFILRRLIPECRFKLSLPTQASDR